jgi:rod shape-determining protein MreC
VARAARLSSRVDLLLFLGCVLLSLVALVLPRDEMREPLAASLRRSLVAPLVALQSSAERMRSAWQMSEERTARLDSVVVRSYNVVALENENDQLRKLLGLAARLRTGFVPAEAVHNEREELVTTLTLTAGSRVGVKTYSPVVTDQGVVGLVQTSDPTISIAILFSHPDFRASAMSGDGTSFGIVYPHQGLATGSGSRYLLELRGVPFRTNLQAGTMIYTSGLGSTFPRGIPIGSVLTELKTGEGWTRTYLVQPAVNLAKVTSVIVLTKAAQRLDNVWQVVARLDSANRGVVNAGDSLVRRLAADSIAKQRAADSAKAAPTPGGTVGTPRPPAVDSVRAQQERDSLRRVTARRDSIRRENLRRDSLRRDSLRRDSMRRDSARDTVRRDTLDRVNR